MIDLFVCPITHEIMIDPVVTIDGHSYERLAIEAWFRKKHTSPKTNKTLLCHQLYPNILLKQIIDDTISSHKTLDIYVLPKKQIEKTHFTNESLRSALDDYYSSTIKFGPIDKWDVSKVTDMSYLFQYNFEFNETIKSWDVSNVKTMEGMFRFATKFNQPLNSWDVSSVINMDKMFYSAIHFNQQLDSWDVSNVRRMNKMFSHALYFNQSLDSWNISSVREMKHMFAHALHFNHFSSHFNPHFYDSFLNYLWILVAN